MRRVRLLLLLFGTALLALVGLLVDRALRSAALERQMRHQAVAERIFDEMERALSRLLEYEEQRPFARYITEVSPSPFPFVVGYFQLDPDGHSHAAPAPPRSGAAAATDIERAVKAYRSGGKVASNTAGPAQGPGTTVEVRGEAAAAASAPSVRDEAAAKAPSSAFDALRALNKGVEERVERRKQAAEYEAKPPDDTAARLEAAPRAAAPPRAAPEVRGAIEAEPELAPMSGRMLDGHRLVLVRTAVRAAAAYRQGVVIDVDGLGDWLRAEGLGGDELAPFARLAFGTALAADASPPVASDFTYSHRFAEPFTDVSAHLSLRALPGVGSIAYVYALSGLLLATSVLGLAALYRMVSVVVRFAERRSNFVAAVSHELKTPLTAIRMYGEMLRDGLVASDAKREEYYRHITVECERLSRLINNVLEYSRLEKGTREVALLSGSLAPVLRDVAVLLRPHVDEQGFALQLEIADDLPAVRFERDALMQVLWNLVDNALKYAREATSRDIVLRCWRGADEVHVTVRDYGPGVATRHLDQIFEPFYRGENELTRRTKGTGLGLALVRGLVERMGARVNGRNAIGGGFEVDVAFRPAAA